MMETMACDTEKFFLIITQTSLLNLWEVIEKARLDLSEGYPSSYKRDR